jgi:hypothetical protein
MNSRLYFHSIDVVPTYVIPINFAKESSVRFNKDH